MENLVKIHALWRLVRKAKANEIDRTSLSEDLVPQEQAPQLLEMGCTLGILEQINQYRYNITKVGHLFSSRHWRYWNPSKKAAEVLHSDLNSFLDHNESRPNIVELFAGAGGLTLGFEKAGYNVAAAFDFDKKAVDSHNKNFPADNNSDHPKSVVIDINNHEMVINAINNRLPNRDIDGVIGGPPCQGFSLMGQRNYEDSRNSLTSRFLDVVEDMQPRFFLMENVPGIISIGAQKLSEYFKDSAKPLGPSANQLIDLLPNAKDFKLTTSREPQFRKKIITHVIRSHQDNAKESIIHWTEKDEAIETESDLRELHAMILQLIMELKNELASHAVSAGYPIEEIEIIFNGTDAMHQIENVSLSFAMTQIATQLNWKEEKLSDFLNQFSNHIERNIHAGEEELEHDLLDIIDRLIRAHEAFSLITDHYTPPLSRQPVFVGKVLGSLIERAKAESFGGENGFNYEVFGPYRLSSQFFNVPQNRDRVFLIGVRTDEVNRVGINNLNLELNQLSIKNNPENANLISTADALSDLPDFDQFPELSKSSNIDSHYLNEALTDFQEQSRLITIGNNDKSLPSEEWNPFKIECVSTTAHDEKVVQRFATVDEGKYDTSKLPRLHRNRQAPTIRAGTGDEKASHTAIRPIHYEYNRVITVREAARLQSYPDWMVFDKTKWRGFMQVGNGVPANLAFEVARTIKAALDN